MSFGSEFEMKPRYIYRPLDRYFHISLVRYVRSSRTTVSVNNHKCNFHFSWTSFLFFLYSFCSSFSLFSMSNVDSLSCLPSRWKIGCEISSRKFFLLHENLNGIIVFDEIERERREKCLFCLLTFFRVLYCCCLYFFHIKYVRYSYFFLLTSIKSSKWEKINFQRAAAVKQLNQQWLHTTSSMCRRWREKC